MIITIDIVIAVTTTILAGTVVTTDIDRCVVGRLTNNSLRSTIGKSVMIDGNCKPMCEYSLGSGDCHVCNDLSSVIYMFSGPGMRCWQIRQGRYICNLLFDTEVTRAPP